MTGDRRECVHVPGGQVVQTEQAGGLVHELGRALAAAGDPVDLGEVQHQVRPAQE
jgi:hypothetical protein